MWSHVIVGAGTAGAIIAARLAEKPGTDVLLLEAGPDYETEATTPADLLDSKNLAGPAHDWGYTAHPIDGRTMPYQRGKVVGGTSAINAAAALWPRPTDLDAWAKLGVHWACRKYRGKTDASRRRSTGALSIFPTTLPAGDVNHRPPVA